MLPCALRSGHCSLLDRARCARLGRIRARPSHRGSPAESGSYRRRRPRTGTLVRAADRPTPLVAGAAALPQLGQDRLERSDHIVTLDAALLEGQVEPKRLIGWP